MTSNTDAPDEKMKIFAPSALACVMLFSLNTASNAQPFWTQVPLPDIYNKVAPYFLDENIGFAFDIGPLRTQPNLRRTTDGGNTWQALRFFDNAGIEIQQIYFTDLHRGYAAASDGIYETNDAGDTWKSIYHIGQTAMSSVYAFDHTVFAFAGGQGLSPESWGPLVSTTNDGATWDTIVRQTTYSIVVGVAVPMHPYVFGNNDGTVYAENIVNGTMILLYSTDNGKNWLSNSTDIQNQTYSMGFFSFPHCNDLLRTYISFVQNLRNDVYQIVHSSDFGAHWDNLGPPIEIGGWIAGNNCVQYVSDADRFQTKGVLRSTDKGKSWAYISGPDFTEIDDGDFRNLSVVGGGAVVYAGDHSQFGFNGSLWKTTSGGDGTLSAAGFASQISILHVLSPGNGDTLKVKECDTGFVIVPFQNISCNVAQLQGITIDGLDSSEFSTLLVHHLFCDGLPDTLLINVIASSAGTRNITVHPRFINDEFETIDTSFAFTLVITSASGTSIYLKSSAISGAASDTLDIPLYVNNISAAPVTLGLDSIDLVYVLNTDVVNPFIFVPVMPGMKAGPIKTTRYSAAFTLYFPPGFIFTGETTLGKLRNEVYVSDTLETGIALSGNTGSSPCQSITSSSSVRFLLASHCLDSSLSKFIKYGTAYSLTSIVPNPARNSVQVELKNNGAQLHYELFDALGNQRKNGLIAGNSLQIDLSDLSAGSYYLRISGEKGIPITKKLVIAK